MRGERRIRIIGGRAGAGKSEFAVNYALRLSGRGQPVAVVDLDVVNPYFTSRGVAGLLERRGVKVIGPSADRTSNDLPAIPAEVLSIFHDDALQVVVDLGGDLTGAKIVGSFKPQLEETGYEFVYLVNANRPGSEDLNGALEYYGQCEEGARLTITAVANTTHLLHETSWSDLERGERLCVELAARKRVPYRYLAALERLFEGGRVRTAAEELFPIRIHLRPEWMDP